MRTHELVLYIVYNNSLGNLQNKQNKSYKHLEMINALEYSKLNP